MEIERKTTLVLYYTALKLKTVLSICSSIERLFSKKEFAFVFFLINNGNIYKERLNKNYKIKY